MHVADSLEGVPEVVLPLEGQVWHVLHTHCLHRLA
jgi:hypothetical protein